MTQIEDKHVLVTGAASGIGRALAVLGASRGARLVLTDVQPLDATIREVEAAGGEVRFSESLDVSSYEAVAAFADRVHDTIGPLDLVMNVAGVSVWGTVSNLRHEDWRSMVEVNLMGPIHVIESFVPAMVTAGRGGHLVNVASAAGLIGLPWHAAYSASKFGLRGVSEVLRFDLRRHGIQVSLVCPGGVDTGLTDTVRVAGVDAASEDFLRVQAAFRRHAVTPESAAESILRGVNRNKYLIYTSTDIRLAYTVQRLVPPAYELAMRLVNRAAGRAVPDAITTGLAQPGTSMNSARR